MPTIAELKAQKLQAEVKRQTLMNEVMMGTLVRVEDVDQAVSEMIVAVRSKLLSYPAQVARIILGKEDYDEVVRILTNKMVETLIDLKNLDFGAMKEKRKTTRVYFDTKAGNLTRGSRNEATK